MRQVEEGTVAAIVINVIENGQHVAATIDTSTTRLSTHPTTAPVVTSIATGIYRIKFTSLSPALSVSDNDDGVTLAVNGDINGTAWSEYHIPINIRAHAFDFTVDEVITDAASRTASQADVSTLASQASVDVIDGIVDDILLDTNELQTNQNNWLTATGFSTHSAADVYTEFTSGTNEDAFKADVSGLATSAEISALNDPTAASIADAVWDELQSGHTTAGSFGAYLDAAVSTAGGGATAADIYTYFTDGTREDAFKADVSGLATSASITALNDPTAASIADAVWDSLSADHTTAGSFGLYLDAAVSTAGGGATAADIYTYFTDSTREDVFKADVSALATQASVDTIDTNVDAILLDTNDLQTNQGNWLTATGFSTHSAADVYTQFTSGSNEDAFKADVSGLATSAEISALNDPTPAEIYTHFTSGTNEDAFKADVSGLSTHSAADVVTALQAVANDFKADISALASQASVDTIDSIVDAIKAKTDQLTFTVANQVDSNALTGGGGDTAATIYTYFTDGTREDAFKADVSGLATQTSVDSIDSDIQNIGSDVSTILTDTNELQQNQNNWLTATGFSTHSAADVYTEFTAGSNEDAFKADVSSLLTDANFNAALPANFSTLIIGTGADAGKVTTSNPAAGSGSAHTAQDVANLILVTPANKLATDASGNVEANNMRGTDNASTHSAADVYTEFTSGSNEDAFKADVSALATSADITSLNDLSSTDITNAVWDASTASHNLAGTFGRGFRQVKEGLVTDESSINDASPTATSFVTALTATDTDFYVGKTLTFISGALAGQSRVISGYNGTTKSITLDEALTSAPSNSDEFIILSTHVHGLTEISTAVYDYFTDSTREDAFKADVSGLATSAEITALNDVSAAEIYTEFTSGSNEDAFKADVSALATQASVNTIDSNVDAIKVKTDQLAFTVAGQVDANALTGGGGDDAATIYTYFTDSTREDAFKADVSALATSAEITALNDITAAEVYTYFTDGTREDAFKANVSGLATSSDITALNDPTAAAIADAVWNEAVADHQNVGSTGEALAGADAPTASEIYSFFTSGTNEDAFKADVSALASQASVTNLNNIDAADVYNYFTSSSRQDLFKADTSGLASQSSVNTIDSNVDAIKVKTDQLTFTVLGQVDANALTGGGGDEAADIYNYFTSNLRQNAFHADLSSTATSAQITALNDVSAFDVYSYFTQGSNEDAFKADVSGLAQSSDVPANFSSLVIDGSGHVTTSNPSVGGGSAHTAADVAALILETPANKIVTNTDGQVEASNGGGGGSPTGSGAISHSVTVKVGGAPLAGADVWITSDQAGNNVVAGTLVTGVTGVVTFQLDPGVYYQWVQLAGYNFVNPSSITVQ